MIDEFSGVSPQVVDVLSAFAAVALIALFAWVIRLLGKLEAMAE